MDESLEPEQKLPQGVELTPHNPAYRDDAQQFYDQLRSHAPRFHDPRYGRIMLTNYDDVRAAIRAKQFSVNAQFSHDDSYLRRIAATGLDKREGDTAYEPPLVMLDDPDHRRVRSLMSKAFTPRAIEGMRDRIEQITAELLDAISGETEIDLVEKFAGPLPTQAILDMMGMTDSSTNDFKRWSEQILMGYDPERDANVREGLRQAYISISKEFRRTVALRRQTPGQDLISAMVEAQENEDRLSDLEIISLCTQLMVAGNVTTTDLICNGLFALLQRREQLRHLCSHPELIDSAVEEMLRFDCPISETARIATQDTTLNGCPVNAGDTLTASLSAANHDPNKFADPHRFDIERENNDHLGFGSGIHVCLGSSLARLETQIAINALLKKFPNITLSTEQKPTRRILPFFSGFTRLVVKLH